MTRSTYALSQVVNLIGGGTPKRSEPSFWNGDIPWLSVKDFNNDSRYVINAEEYITRLGLEKSSTKILDPGMLIISARGTVGELAQLKSQMAFNQSCYGIDANSEYLENDYLYYLLKIKIRELKSIAHGSVFDTITRETFDSIFVSIPPKKEQLAIVEILGALDAKIELNQQMNETLEEIAKTLFKSWFIDFDPVRAKAEGRPTGLSKEIRDLFPDSFEDSELGKIPKGWKAGSLNDIIVRSKDKIKDTKSKVLAAVSSGELVLSEEYFSKQVFSKDISKYIKVEQYDFAYNPSRINIGSIGMNEYDFIGAVSPVYVVFKPFTHWHLFISQFIRLNSTNSKINQLSSGSVRQSLSFDDFASIPITIPTDVANMKFNEIYESLRRKITQNQEECEILTSLRDTLLPKLISGELKIPDAENLIKEEGI